MPEATEKDEGEGITGSQVSTTLIRSLTSNVPQTGANKNCQGVLSHKLLGTGSQDQPEAARGESTITRLVFSNPLYDE